MSLFTPDIELRLTVHEHEVVTRPVNGDGGHQGLLRKLLPRIDRDYMLWMTDDELLKAAHYAFDFKTGGGYQDRFKALVAAARRAGWTRG